MPYRPRKPCHHPGCPNLTAGMYCAEHQPQHKPDTQRPSAHRRGYTKRWQTASKSFLLHHPFCVRCRQQGRLTPATVVDHIVATKNCSGTNPTGRLSVSPAMTARPGRKTASSPTATAPSPDTGRGGLDIPFAEPQETGDPSRVNFRKFHKGGFWKNRPICGSVSGSFVLSAPKSCKGVSPNHAIR